MRKTVLVADDEANLLNLLKDNLEDAGYNVLAAADGEEALKQWVVNKPEAIVLDIEMPKMNGWMVLEEIRKITRNPDSPVIVILSAYVQPGDIKRGLALGANRYITKPFKVGELLAALKELLK